MQGLLSFECESKRLLCFDCLFFSRTLCLSTHARTMQLPLSQLSLDVPVALTPVIPRSHHRRIDELEAEVKSLKEKSSRWAESAAFQQAEHEKWHSHSQRLNRAYDSKAAQCQQLKTKLEQTEKELKLANDSQRNVQWVMQVLNGENAQLDRRVAVVTAELDKTKCQLESLRKSVRELPLMM